MNNNDLTVGKVSRVLVKFSIPYMIACFMQTFYGMADLFIVGLYNGAVTTTAVSIGSQVTHMITVIFVGMTMGTTVQLARSIGAKNQEQGSRVIGNTIILFGLIAIISTVLLVIFIDPIVSVMMTPVEAIEQTKTYLLICFLGIPLIVAYNVISSLFRGIGDSRRPMYFVGIACGANIIFDFIFIGYFKMNAFGAALGTILGQFISVIIGIIVLYKNREIFTFKIKYDHDTLIDIVKVGLPISLQDGLIQVSFIIITIIANSRGLVVAASVGIVEKIISFFFLVPSAFLSAISALSAQNAGANKHDRSRLSLKHGLIITISYGTICFIVCQICPSLLVGLFSKDPAVILMGKGYLMAYAFDIIFAGIHFCFSGYFCGNQRSIISFIHNIVSIVVIRVPGAYLASMLFPNTLYPMGLAAPLGSILSAVICIVFYYYFKKNDQTSIQINR